jgi:hypothetical protein
MKAILTGLILLMATSAWSAELLVMAQDSCADKLCNRKGDIISIRPDGFDWEKAGAGYKKPMWKIVKLPGVKEADAQKYLEPLTEEGTEVIDGETRPVRTMIRDRKYKMDASVLTAMETSDKQVLSVASKDVTTYVAKITEKSLATEKQAVEATNEEIIAE